MAVTEREAMGDMVDSRLLRKIASFADQYEKHEFLPSMERVWELLGNPKKITSIVDVGTAWVEDSLLALASACWYGYARQGAPPRFWRLAAQAIREAAAKVDLESPRFPEEVWSNFVNLCQNPNYCVLEADQKLRPVGPNKKMPTVKDLASLHLEAKNLMSYARQNLKTNATRCHACIKSKVKGMGDKVTAFFLRDIAWVYGLEGKGSLASADGAAYIQPIDVRVRQVAECLWPDLRGNGWLIVARKIIEQCNKSGVSPIEFNQGAWYLGARVIKNAANLCQKLSQLDP
jgi:hypothetical protein